MAGGVEFARDDDAGFIFRFCPSVSFQQMPWVLRVRFPRARITAPGCNSRRL